MSLRPAQIVSGDTWARAWRLTDSAGRAIDLTGASARLHLRTAAGAKVAEAATTDGRVVIDPLAGRIDMRIPAAAMRLPVGGYRYAMEITSADGTVRTIETNSLIVREDVTHG